MTLEPGTRVEFQAPGGLRECGKVMKPKRSQLPLPSADWCIVRFDNGDTICAHVDAFSVVVGRR